MRGDPMPPHEEEFAPMFRLRRMEKDEVGCIELFALTTTCLEGGLSQIEGRLDSLRDAKEYT